MTLLLVNKKRNSNYLTDNQQTGNIKSMLATFPLKPSFTTRPGIETYGNKKYLLLTVVFTSQTVNNSRRKPKKITQEERCHLSQKLFLGTVALMSSKTLRGKHQTLYIVFEMIFRHLVFSVLSSAFGYRLKHSFYCLMYNVKHSDNRTFSHDVKSAILEFKK